MMVEVCESEQNNPTIDFKDKCTTSAHATGEKLKLVQNNILLNAARVCKVGGKIVYITCSLLYDENEFQIKNFLNNCKNFDVINFKEDIKKYIKKKNPRILAKILMK